jgi:ABC-type multidrug transport system fused ATPase/permease subunit
MDPLSGLLQQLTCLVLYSKSVNSDSLNFDLLKRSLRLFDRRAQLRILAVLIIQICLAFVDLLGVAIVGLLGALTVTGIQSVEPPQGGRISVVLNFLGLGSQTFQEQIAILGGLAAFLLVSRTLISIFFTRRSLKFLSFQAAKISSDMFSKTLNLSLLDLRRNTSQELLYYLTVGVNTITVGIIGTSMSIAADLFLMSLLIAGLILVSPGMAFSTFFVFAGIGYLLYKLLHNRARTLGEENASLSMERNEKVIEVIRTYRESVVKGRRDYYSNYVRNIRFSLASTEAELAFMPNISKYVLEIATVIGGLFICAIEFYLNDASHAIATLAVFLAAGSRIAPAILRLQQGALYVRGGVGSALPTLRLIERLENLPIRVQLNDEVDYLHNEFSPRIEIEKLTLTYPGKSTPAVDDVDLRILPGQQVAIVGPSGAGKTSLVDLLLGIILPSSGRVLISELVASEAILRWPGAVAYVPQDVAILSGSIKENVCLGYAPTSIENERVWEALRFAQLEEFVEALPEQLETEVGEFGAQLSGGQRQRLGIARAMLTHPKLVILDEATSALDGQTESALTEALEALHGEVTTVVIAHRLSTIRLADQVVYLENGQVKAVGTFSEVRSKVSNFDHQAKLIGL